ncbi:hypothetical protein MNB_ARC-1_1141 [hydrothermal vent metagenome]|uniref:Uncharacterized protein n=1 Tax=hydrothermal vent metagenome TaxID=652676 RepID=A0A3B1E9J3_9ZZZZ
MKNLIKLIIVLFCIQSFTYGASVYGNAYHLAYQLAVEKKIKKLILKVLYLKEIISTHILTHNGDLNITNANFATTNFDGYGGSHISFTIVDNAVIKFTNVLPPNINQVAVEYFVNHKHKKLESALGVIGDDNRSIEIPLNIEAIKAIAILEMLNNNTKINVNPNEINRTTDIKKIQYKLRTSGEFDVYKYSKTQKSWINYGVIGKIYHRDTNKLSREENKVCLGTFESYFDLYNVVALDGECAVVYENQEYTQYTYVVSRKSWYNTALRGEYGSQSAILNMALSSSELDVNTTLLVGSINGEFKGLKYFKKMSKQNIYSGGKSIEYWIDRSSRYIILNRSRDWNQFANVPVGTIFYVPDRNHQQKILLSERYDVAPGVKFRYIAYGYKDVIDRYLDDIVTAISRNGSIIYDKINNKSFVWSMGSTVESKDGRVYLSRLARSSLSSIATSGPEYYTLVNDCRSFSCGGSVNENYFNGVITKDGLYRFVYNQKTNALAPLRN